MREMKESGIRWVGKIPYSWKVDKNKHYFNLEKNIVGDKMNEYELLSLTKKGVIKKDENSIGGKVPESFETYQSVKKGQIVMCLFDLDVSAVFSGLSPYNGMISPAYKIYNCNKNMYNKYAKYWFECCFDGRKYKAYSKSLRYVVNTEDFGPIEIVCPPIEEQEKIANFLDEKVLEIDSIIEKTKQTIEDYKKYKQSVITEGVTKGIDENNEMKDSKIEWIGQTPAHWSIKRNKFVAESLLKGNGITKEDVLINGNIQCVRYGEIYSKYENSFENTFSRTNIEKINSPRFIEVGDILFAGTGELVEEIGKNILYKGNQECLAGGDIIVMKHKQNPRFINYALNSISSQEQKSCGKAKLKVVHISAADIGNILIAIPPLEEQKLIADYLDRICIEINSVIANKEKIVEELERYKKSLIYEYVTGKKEVI